jgi:hypothetical protein
MPVEACSLAALRHVREVSQPEVRLARTVRPEEGGDPGRRGQRRGPRPGLSADTIVDAAVRLADAEGLEAVSIARVAAGDLCEVGFPGNYPCRRDFGCACLPR